MIVLDKIMGFQGTKSERWAAISLYIAGGTYSLTMAMLIVMVPLYALHLGYDVKTMGVIVASQAIFQFALRLFGGILADRFGERLVLILSFSSMVVAAVMFNFAVAASGLIWAQVFVGFSRSVYWNAAQSYGSRVSAVHADAILGRFLGYGSGGQIAGATIAGVAIETLGYQGAFLVCTGLCTVALLTSFTMPDIPRKGASRTVREVLRPFPQIIRNKVLWLGFIIAFVGSSQTALVGSIYPAFFKQDLGFNAADFGIYRSVYAAGLVFVGFLFSSMMARFGHQALFALCMLGMGVMTLLTPTMGYLVAPLTGTMLVIGVGGLGVFMLLLGSVFGISRILYPVTAAQNSLTTQRGLAMSAVGLGWAAAQLIIPILFGYIADATDLDASLVIAGIWMVLVGVSTPLIYRRLSPPNRDVPEAFSPFIGG